MNALRKAIAEHANIVRARQCKKNRLVSEKQTAELCVLIVEDDAEIRCGTEIRLRAAGYTVRTARNGREALEAATALHPDAIVLDIRMPHMDGLTVLGKLRERQETGSIPVIMLSASVVDQQASLDAGARFFMKKPYQARYLLAAIDSAIQPSQHS